MKRIEKWLNENGLEYENIQLADGNKALMIKTDYRGPHPRKETFDKIYMIERKINRFKRLKMETRGYYTGVLIREA